MMTWRHPSPLQVCDQLGKSPLNLFTMERRRGQTVGCINSPTELLWNLIPFLSAIVCQWLDFSLRAGFGWAVSLRGYWTILCHDGSGRVGRVSLEILCHGWERNPGHRADRQWAIPQSYHDQIFSELPFLSTGITINNIISCTAYVCDYSLSAHLNIMQTKLSSSWGDLSTTLTGIH